MRRPDVAHKRDRAKHLGRLVNGRRFDLVSRIRAIMVHGEPTVFAYEAPIRHGIRSGLILSGGWTWKAADAAAAEVVREVLNQLGAKRPTWQQGQPGWTEEGIARLQRDNCARCGKPIPMERLLQSGGGGWVKYCDSTCAFAAQSAMKCEREGEEGKARHAAEVAAAWRRAKDAMPLKPCEYCGDLFHPTPAKKDRPETRYCTPRCRNKARAGTPQARTWYRGQF